MYFIKLFKIAKIIKLKQNFRKKSFKMQDLTMKTNCCKIVLKEN